MDGIAQVYDTNAAHPPATEEMRGAIRVELPGRSVLVGTVDGIAAESGAILAEYPGDIFVTITGTYRVVSWWRGVGSGR